MSHRLDRKAHRPEIDGTKVNFMKSATFGMPLLAVAGLAMFGGVTAQAPAAPAVAQPSAPRLSFGVAEVAKLSHAKLSDEAIISFIQNSRRSYEMSAADIVYLHEDGVSDKVITAMLDKDRKVMETANLAAAPVPAPQPAPAPAPASAPTPAPTVVAQAPTVVTQPQTTYVQPAPVYVYSSPAPVIYEPYPYYRPYYGYYGYPAVSLSFGFGRGYHGGGFRGGFHGHH